MEAMEAIRSRYSCRTYSDRPVSDDLICQILDAARRAPSGNNVQPWEFVVVRDPSVREKLSQITDYGKFIRQAPVCIVVLCRDTKYYLEDGAAATQNILLACTALGLGSCWIAGDKKPYCDEILQLLGVPRQYRLVSLVSVGYPAGPPKYKPRRPLSEIVHWERYGSRSETCG